MSETKPTIHIEISNPLDGSQVPANHVVYLRASASAGSKNLDERIRWRSNLDGFLGQGGDVPVELSPGEHKLRAAVRHPREKPGRSRKARSQAGEDQADSDGAKDDVTVHAVPVDYPDGDT